MTEFADLTPYRYLRSEFDMVNVGWLGRTPDFPTGPVDETVRAELRRRVAEPEQLTRGFHGCELCAGGPLIWVEVGGKDLRLGNGEIHACGADGVRYAAPTLIVHYIEEHGYRPPEEFLAAVRGEAAA
jgi:hypothetical protein